MNKKSLKDLILSATSLLCDTVGCTLGPDGQLVTFTKNSNGVVIPFVTKDGATVASFIDSDDRYENTIMVLIREAANKTMRQVGDGTTSTCIMSKYLIEKGIDLTTKKVVTPRVLAETLDILIQDIIELSKKYVTSIGEDEDELYYIIKDIASISGNSEEIGELIADIYDNIGPYGHIEIVPNFISTKVSTDKVKGMHIKSGWSYSWMVTNKISKVFEHYERADHEDRHYNINSKPHILLLDDSINDANNIIKYCEMIGKDSALLVLCDNMSEGARNLLSTFTIQNNFRLCISFYPGIAADKPFIINDLRMMTGAMVVKDLTTPKLEYLGECNSIVVRDLEMFIGLEEYHDQKSINIEIEKIKIELEKEIDSLNESVWVFNRELNKKRLGYLTGGTAVIKVGGNTQSEALELRDRYEDAILAVRSAIESGLILGGGYTARQIYRELVSNKKDEVYIELAKVLLQVTITLINNSEIEEYIKKEILYNENSLPFNFKDRCFVEISDYNVKEPLQVLIQALINASSVAKLLLNTKYLIVDGIRY